MKFLICLLIAVLAFMSVTAIPAATGPYCDAAKQVPALSTLFRCLWELVNDYFDPIDWMDDK